MNTKSPETTATHLAPYATTPQGRTFHHVRRNLATVPDIQVVFAHNRGPWGGTGGTGVIVQLQGAKGNALRLGKTYHVDEAAATEWALGVLAHNNI